MSNHIHLICYVKDPFLLSDVMRDFKKITSKAIIDSTQKNDKKSRKEWMIRIFEYYATYNKNNKTHQFWQQDSKPIELESPKWINKKLAYIHMNLVLNGVVQEPEAYAYSSARDYLGMAGYLEIEKIELDNNARYLY